MWDGAYVTRQGQIYTLAAVSRVKHTHEHGTFVVVQKRFDSISTPHLGFGCAHAWNLAVLKHSSTSSAPRGGQRLSTVNASSHFSDTTAAIILKFQNREFFFHLAGIFMCIIRR